MKNTFTWKFIDSDATFRAQDPQRTSSLYFPLANEAEMMSSIAPELKGDIKTDNNSFLLAPVSRPDLLFNHSSRNFWVYSKKGVWSLADAAATTELTAGQLFHSVTRINKKIGLKATVTNFVPAANEHLEIMLIEIENISSQAIEITATSAIAIYGRSADNLRDHRHVSSLLNRITQEKRGIVMQPVMSFDERGHTKNQTRYYVFGFDAHNAPPVGSFPTFELFFGEGNNYLRPAAVYENHLPKQYSPAQLNGKEAMGALRFRPCTIKPKQILCFGLVLGIAATDKELKRNSSKYKTISSLKNALGDNKRFWKERNSRLSFTTGNFLYDNWVSWVGLQPQLRKIFGCSFLPDFDYGRGGKGWRDLWQDCLSLLLTNPGGVRKLLVANFSGVRIDGTNATIITKKPGVFLADRNKISRVWMDHGVWPYFTTELYINQTGDFSILFDTATYFCDSQIQRAHAIDPSWDGSPQLKTKHNKIYKASVLEHILAQHLVQFFNVGPRNTIRLENADWNDGLDMAADKGESVSFSAFYAYNLKRIAGLLKTIRLNKKITRVMLLKELTRLLDSLDKPIDYNSVTQKTKLLAAYLNAVQPSVSGKQVPVLIDLLICDLERKADWLIEHIHKKEWIGLSKTTGIFNGYYDNRSRRVEGKYKNTVRMTLTGQVFAILSGAASQEQVEKIFSAGQQYLCDKKLHGLRLNTDFGSPQFDLGRAFAFAYGEKENGAIFSHMCVMFAYALYSRGFAREGFETLNSLFTLAANAHTSRIYPNLPEYFNLDGRGMYSYLTGSASWYIMTLLTQAFGIRGEFGNLVLEPKLTREQFNGSTKLSVCCEFVGKKLTISFVNPRKLSYPHYQVKKVDAPLYFNAVDENKILFDRKDLVRLPSPATITLHLG